MSERPSTQHLHRNDSFHHHHSHAHGTGHPAGHHLLQVEGLTIRFKMYESEGFFSAAQEERTVIENLSIAVHEGEMIALVGASGSGKTLLADAILGMYEPNSVVTGNIWFDGALQTAESLTGLRGDEIAFVPQSVEALDPLMRVGQQVQGGRLARGQAVRTRRVEQNGDGMISRKDAKQARGRRQEELFERYGLKSNVAKMFPHELSGGMLRRVLLCCALMDAPRLLIADEPTPGMDHELAKRALHDLRAFADDGGGVMLITHDIELALTVADRIAIFKEGTIVEETSVEAFKAGELHHPFSRALAKELP